MPIGEGVKAATGGGAGFVQMVARKNAGGAEQQLWVPPGPEHGERPHAYL
jgi:hypothetical protein